MLAHGALHLQVPHEPRVPRSRPRRDVVVHGAVLGAKLAGACARAQELGRGGHLAHAHEAERHGPHGHVANDARHARGGAARQVRFQGHELGVRHVERGARVRRAKSTRAARVSARMP